MVVGHEMGHEVPVAQVISGKPDGLDPVNVVTRGRVIS